MTSPRTLLVAHDFSKRADRAIRRARMLSGDQGRIIVFHATPNAERLDAIRDQLWARLRTMLVPEELGRFTIETHGGAPEGVAARLAQTHDADLLLLGSHGKAGLIELLTTNTMARMISALQVPTLIAKISPPKPYRKVLVGIDFAETSGSALAFVCDWFSNAEVTAAHAFDVRLGRRAMGPVRIDELDESRKQWLANVVANAGDSVSKPPVHTALLPGSPAETLRKAAEDLGCDLIALGRHNRGWLFDAMLGSVARSLLANPPCDVLVVPPKKGNA